MADIDFTSVNQALQTGVHSLATLKGLQEQQRHNQALEMRASQMTKIAQDQEEREQKKFSFEQKQLSEREKALDAPMDITVHPYYLALPDEVKPNVIKYFDSKGYTKEGKGKTRDIMQGVGEIENSKALFTQFMGPKVEQTKQELIAAELELLKNPNDEKKKEKTLGLRKQFQVMSGTYDKHVSEMEKQKEMEDRQVALEKTKGEEVRKTQKELLSSRERIADKRLAEVRERLKKPNIQMIGVDPDTGIAYFVDTHQSVGPDGKVQVYSSNIDDDADNKISTDETDYKSISGILANKFPGTPISPNKPTAKKPNLRKVPTEKLEDPGKAAAREQFKTIMKSMGIELTK